MCGGSGPWRWRFSVPCLCAAEIRAATSSSLSTLASSAASMLGRDTMIPERGGAWTSALRGLLEGDRPCEPGRALRSRSARIALGEGATKTESGPVRVVAAAKSLASRPRLSADARCAEDSLPRLCNWCGSTMRCMLMFPSTPPQPGRVGRGICSTYSLTEIFPELSRQPAAVAGRGCGAEAPAWRFDARTVRIMSVSKPRPPASPGGAEAGLAGGGALESLWTKATESFSTMALRFTIILRRRAERDGPLSTSYVAAKPRMLARREAIPSDRRLGEGRRPWPVSDLPDWGRCVCRPLVA